MTKAPFFFVACAIVVGCSSNAAPNPGGPPSCNPPGLFCLCVTGACTCTGTERCSTTCGNGCTVACTGIGGCDAACGTDCTATCTGTEPCSFHTGMGSEIACTGTGGCDTTCEGGACHVTCDDIAGCLLRCPSGGDCTLTCVGIATDCGGGVQVCGRDCPLTR